MSKKHALAKLAQSKIERLIHIVRGQRVMIDTDLADLYGVQTKVFNQAVKRNRNRFPLDFAYQVTEQEFINLRSQIVTSNGAGGRRYRPWVFTEQGVAMLSTVLKSPLAIAMSIEIIRVFVRLRHLLATPGEIVNQLQKIAETVELHEEQIKAIADVLRQMMEPPPEPPKGRFGFQAPEPRTTEPTKESS